jgi:calcium-dependent protein kinase
MKNNTIVGTPLYMAIEILKGESYSSKCDIWALGFIFY